MTNDTEYALSRVPARVTEKISFPDEAGGCWQWDGYLDNQGYGRIVRNGKTYLAHRLIWALLTGKPHTGALDHLCRVRHCVRPLHLEPVPHVVNVMRGNSPPAMNARKVACKWGHPFSGENLRILTRKNGRQRRVCVKCSEKSKPKHQAQMRQWHALPKNQKRELERERRRKDTPGFREHRNSMARERYRLKKDVAA